MDLSMKKQLRLHIRYTWQAIKSLLGQSLEFHFRPEILSKSRKDSLSKFKTRATKFRKALTKTSLKLKIPFLIIVKSRIAKYSSLLRRYNIMLLNLKKKCHRSRKSLSKTLGMSIIRILYLVIIHQVLIDRKSIRCQCQSIRLRSRKDRYSILLFNRHLLELQVL